MESQDMPDTRVYDSDSWEETDTISILVATDNHLGCFEKDAIRGEDSFTTFEEILKIAATEKVDMILLGGDLFHENKPSRHTLHKTMTLLRQYCWGDKPCHLQFLSDQSINFQDSFGTANYMDPNINVSIPVFSIHGNHDEPCGKGGLCSLDLLSTAGLVNYFGKTPSVDDITIHPILLQKGSTRLALYGLGNVRDERLQETFNKGGVQIMRPSEDSDAWFNLLTLHQNRVAHTRTSYIPENYLDELFDLVIWGHEHECLIDPQLNLEKGFYVSQPGSSIATSLIEGESVPKHVALIKVNNVSFHLRKVPLKTVRPFNHRSIQYDIQPKEDPNDFNQISKFMIGQIDEMIQQSYEDYQELCPDVAVSAIPKPLIRLRVELGPNTEVISPVRFMQSLINKVANPRDAVFFTRPKAPRADKTRNRLLSQMAAHAFSQPNSGLNTLRIENLFLDAISDFKPNLIPARPMFDAIQKYVFKGEKDSITDLLDSTTKEALRYLKVHCESDQPEIIRDEVRQFTERKFLNTETQKDLLATPEPVPENSSHPEEANNSPVEDDWDSPPNQPLRKKPASHLTKKNNVAFSNPKSSNLFKNQPKKTNHNDESGLDSDDSFSLEGIPTGQSQANSRNQTKSPISKPHNNNPSTQSSNGTGQSDGAASSLAAAWDYSVVDPKSFSQIFDSDDEADEFYVPPTPTLGPSQSISKKNPPRVTRGGNNSSIIPNSGGQTQLSFNLPRRSRANQPSKDAASGKLSQASMVATEIISDDDDY